MKKINLILKIVLLSMLIVFSNFHYVRANENSNEMEYLHHIEND